MMPGWVMSLAGWLGRVALATGAAMLALWSARRGGKTAGRAEARAKTMEDATDAQRRMLGAAADRPRDRAALADRLRGGRF